MSKLLLPIDFLFYHYYKFAKFLKSPDSVFSAICFIIFFSMMLIEFLIPTNSTCIYFEGNWIGIMLRYLPLLLIVSFIYYKRERYIQVIQYFGNSKILNKHGDIINILLIITHVVYAWNIVGVIDDKIKI